MIDKEVLLSQFTTLGIGGPAREFVDASSTAEIVDAVADADAHDMPVLVLGGGSNMLISDDGFNGRCVRVANRGITETRDGDAVVFDVQAGESWDDFVRHAIAQGCHGVECMSGIPGLVGGAAVQNIGAYGEEIRSYVESVVAYDRGVSASVAFDNESCGFAYRTSTFKGDATQVVTQVSMRLQCSTSSVPITYKELATKLGVSIGGTVPMQEARNAVLELRRGKGMVVDVSDADSRSVGSFFTNPIIDNDAFDRLCTRAGVEPPHWPAGSAKTKVSAAWLIGKAGFARGYGEGPARISSKHTLALVNTGGATSRDVLALAREVRDAVSRRFEVVLQPEPVFVGVSL